MIMTYTTVYSAQVNITTTLHNQYLKPLLDIVEGFLVRDVVDDDDSVSSPVV